MKTKLLLTIAACANVMLIFFACQEQPKEPVASEKPTKEELVKRGEYLVNTMGCDDCHSPKIFTAQGPVPDPERRFSGHPADAPLAKVDTSMLKDWSFFTPDLTAAVGPWGASFSANLTSDATGIGNWTLNQFKKALREGKYKGMGGSRMLLPPMPWPNYGKLSDEDIEAVFTFLQSTKPVHNIVPAPKSVAELQ